MTFPKKSEPLNQKRFTRLGDRVRVEDLAARLGELIWAVLQLGRDEVRDREPRTARNSRSRGRTATRNLFSPVGECRVI